MVLKTLIGVVVICLLLVTSLFSESNIRVTKHNLASDQMNSELGNEDICVVCHTPNVVKITNNGSISWDKNFYDTPYLLYGMVDRNSSDTNIKNNSSMACLSCHDGISAINIPVNLGRGGREDSHSLQQVGNLSMALQQPSNSKTNHPISIQYEVGKAGLKSLDTSLYGWTNAKNIENLLRDSRIECSSCHDPHEGTNARFLRIRNNSSTLCFGCHEK